MRAATVSRDQGDNGETAVAEGIWGHNLGEPAQAAKVTVAELSLEGLWFELWEGHFVVEGILK
jgi:hypothetical protein